MKYMLTTLLILMMSLIFVQAMDEELNRCLCVCSCGEAGWDCGAVSCYYNPSPVDASPACADAGLGQCVCQGYGCGRAEISTKCAEKCMEEKLLRCEKDEVILNDECVHIDKACTGKNMKYDYELRDCTCDAGYYYVDGKCVIPNRERKNYYNGIKSDGKRSYRIDYGSTITKTYTVKAREDAVGVSIFKVGRVWPTWLAKYVTVKPPTLHLNPGESGKFEITINTNKESFHADQNIFYYIEGMDDKYSYLITEGITTYLNEPEINEEYEDVVYENSEIYNGENTLIPEMPTETSGNVFEDVKRVIRASAFGTEAAGKMESLIDMYSSDPEGEKNLLTALAFVGLFPEDKIPLVIQTVNPGMTIGSLTKEIAGDYLESKKEDALKQVVDVTGMLSGDAKKQIFKNLSKVLPQMLEYKYTIEKTQFEFRKEMDLQNRKVHGGDD